MQNHFEMDVLRNMKKIVTEPPPARTHGVYLRNRSSSGVHKIVIHVSRVPVGFEVITGQ